MQYAVTNDGAVVHLHEDGTWERPGPGAPALQRWGGLDLSSQATEIFSGLFERIGVEIVDSGETLTVTQGERGIGISAGLDHEEVEFTVRIYGFQVERLARALESGTIDEIERFRIAREMLGAVSGGKASIFHNPLLSNPTLRKITKAKSLCHLHVLSPDKSVEPDALFTLIFVNNSWLLVDGLHGAPERTFHVTVENAVELQRELLRGMRTDSLTEWIRIAKWYVDWRRRVEVETA